MYNLNNIVISHLKINSLRQKFDVLKYLIKGNIDILALTETKLDQTFPTYQFTIDEYSLFRLDRTSNGGGVFIYVRDDH